MNDDDFYWDLLKKYIALVLLEEGTTFIVEGTLKYAGFDEDEARVLERLNKEVYKEYMKK